jgi:hypothetical protein
VRLCYEHMFVYDRAMDSSHDQRALLAVLLNAHPAMLTTTDAAAMLSDAGDLEEAAELLRQDGLVNRVGDLIGASRSAVRAHQLRV